MGSAWWERGGGSELRQQAEPGHMSPQDLEQQASIYTKGCVGQFEKWLQDNLIVVAGVLVGIALLQVNSLGSNTLLPPLLCALPHLLSVLQIFGICLAQNLVSDIKAVKANW